MPNLAVVLNEHRNGLKPGIVETFAAHHVKIQINDYDELQRLIHEYISEPQYVIAYLDYHVLIGKCENNGFSFYNQECFKVKYLQKLRVFNIDGEVFLWRTGYQTYSIRIRKDGTNDEHKRENVMDAWQILWGTTSKSLNGGWSELSEERGTRFIVPLQLDVDNRKKRLKIHTRSYVGFNSLNQAGYTDCRMVAFDMGGE